MKPRRVFFFFFLILFRFHHRISLCPLLWCRHAKFKSADCIRRLLLRKGHTKKAHRVSSLAAGRQHVLIERARCGWPAVGTRSSAWKATRTVAVNGADSRSGSSRSPTQSSPGETHIKLIALTSQWRHLTKRQASTQLDRFQSLKKKINFELISRQPTTTVTSSCCIILRSYAALR